MCLSSSLLLSMLGPTQMNMIAAKKRTSDLFQNPDPWIQGEKVDILALDVQVPVPRDAKKNKYPPKLTSAGKKGVI